jgi:hypothetical protein
MEGLLGLPEGSRGPLSASRVSTIHPNPTWHPKPSSLWPPRFLPPCTGPSRGTPRSLPVVPLIGDKRYYGEAPVGLWRYERAVGDAVLPIPTRTGGTELISQVLQCQNVTRPTWETRRGSTVVSPSARRRGAGCPRQAEGRRVRLQLQQRQ